MANYTNGTVKAVTTPLDGSPSMVTIEADNPNHDPEADPPDPGEPPRKDFTFEFEHEKTIDRLIAAVDGPPPKVTVNTDSGGAPTSVTYHK